MRARLERLRPGLEAGWRDMLRGSVAQSRGSDTFQFNVLPWSTSRVTDFTPGVDVLDFHGLFAAAGYQGSDPVADGYLSFAVDAAGSTKIYFDPDGPGTANPWPFLIATLDNVLPSSLHMQSDWFFH